MCDIFIMCFVLFLFVTCFGRNFNVMAAAAARRYMAADAAAAAECERKMLLLLLVEREEIGGVVRLFYVFLVFFCF